MMQLNVHVVEAKTGASIVVPPGVWHTYSNPSDARAKYLLYISPGGFEKFLEALAEMTRAEQTGRPTDKTKLHALAEQYDATI